MEIGDLPWLLKQLENISQSFYSMYKIDILIPNIIHLSYSEVKSWYQMEKNKIVQMDEDYYKISLVRDYYENLAKSVQNTEKNNFVQQNLCYFQCKVQGQEAFRKLDYETMNRILDNVSEYQEFVNSIVKIFDCFRNEDIRNLKFFRLELEKDFENKNKSIKVFIKKFEIEQLEPKDYEKNYTQIQNSPKSQKQKKELIQSRSQTINQHFELLLNSIVHFLEGKTKKVKDQYLYQKNYQQLEFFFNKTRCFFGFEKSNLDNRLF